MKTRWLSIIICVCTAVALILTGSVQAQTEGPIITSGGGPNAINSAFTYQGMLKMGGSPVNGTCDFQFTLFDRSSSGNQIGVMDDEPGVSVANGLFTVVLNYGDLSGGPFDPKDPINYYAFSGNQRWLEIAVRCPTGSGIYTPLTPRQPLWAAPYAITLMPGAHIVGSAYQNLKVSSFAATGGIPAAVTGEIKTATDGVGLYGSNEVYSDGATGMGVWGRTYSPAGYGVRGTGLNGAAGVFGETSGVPSVAAILAQNHGTGDNYKALNPAGDVVFRVLNNGQVWSNGGFLTSTGADVAEKFAVSASAVPEPGTLMVIDPDHPGQLKPSDSAYDNKVAGIVSGAGGLQPGVTLSDQDGVPIALAGRVYVKAEAYSGAIVPGDLLTSSSMPGYAMKASDHNRAIGAVIGKAMTGLDSATGLVLVLVSLQ